MSWRAFYMLGESKLTVSVPQLAGLVRCASNLAQSGFDSPRNLLPAGCSGRTNKKGTLMCALFCISAAMENRTPIFSLATRRFTTKLWPQYLLEYHI